jgi:energy-coupling factor transporter transmembrane protein EcfT
LHPASRILIYLVAALVIPGLSFLMLSLLLLVALLRFLQLRQHPFKLVWRTRWLMLVLVLGYGYSLPGIAAISFLGDWSPSHAGLLRGSAQALRLLALLLWLDLLVLRMSASSLLCGLHLLMRPFSLLGVDSQRAALRLGLTLRAIDRLERGRGNLKRLLRGDDDMNLPERIHLDVWPVRFLDVLIPALLTAALAGLWLHA